MKMKSVLASLGACAIALSAMAVSASAAADSTMLEGFGKEDEWGKYMDMVEMYSSVADVKTVEITVKDGEFNGCVNVSSDSTSWGWNPVTEGKANGDGTFTVTVPVTLAASDNLVKIGVQDWNEGDGVSSVVKVVLKDGSGKVLFEKPEAAADDKQDETKADDKKDETKADDQKDETKTESKSDEKKDDTKTVGTSADDTKKDDSKKNEPSSKTGDAGAGFAIAGLAVAGAAAFVARKKH